MLMMVLETGSRWVKSGRVSIWRMSWYVDTKCPKVKFMFWKGTKAWQVTGIVVCCSGNYSLHLSQLKQLFTNN